MTKKELEEREIKLEAIVQAYREVVDKFFDLAPFATAPVRRLQNISDCLYNAAEVKPNIGELVDLNFKYEGEEEE
jgi:hypothetical protein